MALQAHHINGDPRTIWGVVAGLHPPLRHGTFSGCQTCAEVYILLVQLRAPDRACSQAYDVNLILKRLSHNLFVTF